MERVKVVTINGHKADLWRWNSFGRKMYKVSLRRDGTAVEPSTSQGVTTIKAAMDNAKSNARHENPSSRFPKGKFVTVRAIRVNKDGTITVKK